MIHRFFLCSVPAGLRTMSCVVSTCILTHVHSQKCAAAVIKHAPSPQQVDDYVKMIIAHCPAADAWWHVIVDWQTLFALLDCEGAGETGDFDTYNHILILANLMFVRCGNTSYFPMIAEFIAYFSCCSEAEWAFTAKKVFTKTTRNGTR